MREAPPKFSGAFFVNGVQMARQDLFAWFSKHRLLLGQDHPLVRELKAEIGPVLDGFEEIRRRQEEEPQKSG